jgi:hypothetical protein
MPLYGTEWIPYHTIPYHSVVLPNTTIPIGALDITELSISTMKTTTVSKSAYHKAFLSRDWLCWRYDTTLFDLKVVVSVLGEDLSSADSLWVHMSTSLQMFCRKHCFGTPQLFINMAYELQMAEIGGMNDLANSS